MINIQLLFLLQWHHETWHERYYGSNRQWQNIVRRLCMQTHTQTVVVRDTFTYCITPSTRQVLSFSVFARLLDVLAGRKDPAGLRQGTVLVDGKTVTSDLRLRSAYVVQVHIYTGIHTNIFFVYLQTVHYVHILFAYTAYTHLNQPLCVCT